MSDGVTLANILGSQVSMQWYEAVAVVREVADRLASASSDRAIPELQQIRLSAEGYLDILGVIATDEPVRRMGQLLQALLVHAEAPVQLRLVITQATAPNPQYRSIREYSDALGFFERPERSTVLQSLASRVTAAAASAPATHPLTLDTIAPLPGSNPKEQDESKKSGERRNRRWRAWGAALVALVVLGAAGGGLWYAHKRGLGPQNKEEASDLANRASDAVGTAIVHGASAVTDTLGLGRIVPAKELDPPAPAPEPPPPPPKVPQSRRREPATPVTEAVPSIIAFDLEPGSAEESAPSAPPEVASTTASAAPSVEREQRDTIYSADSRITPPVGVRPKLARQLPPDFDPTRLGRIELIIGVDGSVESAKLLGPPRTVNDGLFLSVAKAWMFQPALRNGVPVRYRKTIWVESP
jgi:cytoskeletal protein RodZ